ncbi:hypothetical protein L9F63_002112, partial [Diploptera punctata]
IKVTIFGGSWLPHLRINGKIMLSQASETMPLFHNMLSLWLVALIKSCFSVLINSAGKIIHASPLKSQMSNHTCVPERKATIMIYNLCRFIALFIESRHILKWQDASLFFFFFFFLEIYPMTRTKTALNVCNGNFRIFCIYICLSSIMYAVVFIIVIMEIYLLNRPQHSIIY